MKTLFAVAALLLFALFSIESIGQSPIQAKIIGDQQFENGKFEEAIKSYTIVIEDDKKKASVFINRGQCYVKLNQYENAIPDFNAAIKLAPEYAFAYYLRGSSYFNLNQLNKALTDLNRAINLDSDNSSFYLKRSKILCDQNKFEAALKDADYYLEIEPENPKGFETKGDIYKKQKSYDNALIWYDKTLEKDSSNAYAYLSKADCYRYTNRIAESKKNLLSAYELDSSSFTVLNNLAYMYIREENFSQAALEFKKLTKLFPENSFPMNNYGFALFKSGQIEEGKAAMLKALEIDKTNSYVHRNLALLYIEIGEKKKACKELKLAIRKGFTEEYGSEVQDLLKEQCN